MKIALFGETGQVATEIRRTAPGDVSIDVIGRDRADFLKPDQVAEATRGLKADAIINAAAYTNVNKAEDEPDQAHLINATSVGRLGQVAADKGIPLVHISTDYVFPGTGTAPWAPDDETDPLGVYGACKLEGEIALRKVGGAHVILRTSWVFSAHGNNFVKTMLRLGAEREELTVVDDQIGGPTPAAGIAAACLRIARAMADGAPGGTYHYSGAPDISWAGFAREIFTQSGQKTEVMGIPSSEYPSPVARPANSRLNCDSLLADFAIQRPDWKEGLAAILRELKT